MLFHVTGLTMEVRQFFILILIWAAAVHIIRMCSIHNLKGGKTAMKGGKIPPWPYVEKSLETTHKFTTFNFYIIVYARYSACT